MIATLTAPSTTQIASLKALVNELPTTERIAVSRYFGITGTEPGDLFSIAEALSTSVIAAAVLVATGHERLVASLQDAEVLTMS
jgi:hypothetical protein